MYEAMSIAASGLRSQQMRLDVIANNVSNINTVAYKATRLDFKDALYTYGLVPGPPRSPDENQQKGHGVNVAHIGREFRPGPLQSTLRDLDFGIEQEGFFTVVNQNGDLLYTRKGNFNISAEDDALYIVTSEGYYVLDENGNRIGIPLDATQVNCDTDGTLRFMRGDEEVGAQRFNIVTFRNLYGLAAAGEGNYAQTPAAGEIMAAEGYTVRQGTLEGTNVDLAEEMTRLIRTQRAFQLASRALTTSDEMEGVANNMKRA